MPVIRGNLKREDRRKIISNYTFLLSELDGKFLANYLYEAKIFDDDDKHEISSKDSPKEKAECFLQKLLHSGPGNAYIMFLKTLEKHYPHVAEILEETPQEGDALNTEKTQSQEVIQLRKQVDQLLKEKESNREQITQQQTELDKLKEELKLRDEREDKFTRHLRKVLGDVSEAELRRKVGRLSGRQVVSSF